ncbi:MAG TPA: NAD(P)-dependent oxidoreductase [Bacteroidales bacterium]|nr:NAD(P)-dependent oxidoreductase [Bacteroidales bacterium]
MNVLLTGASGFIGSHVLIQLLNSGHSVTALVRNAKKVSELAILPKVQVVEADITDFKTIASIVKGHDACVHVALNYNDTSAYDMLMSDTAPSIFLASECAKAGVSHFIYTSSTAANDSIYAVSNPAVIAHTNAHVTTASKHDPHTYYGATKAATENFLFGITGSTNMRVTIIRPGYTFGNPALPGGYTQPDRRFHTIAHAAANNKDIEITKNDGTQFIWAPDLASIYCHALKNNNNKKTYFGLSQSFTSWEYVALEAIRICNSNSKIILHDLGWSSFPIMFDVSDIEKDFGLQFQSIPHISTHLSFLLAQEK